MLAFYGESPPKVEKGALFDSGYEAQRIAVKHKSPLGGFRGLYV